jgi:hypothetical protein
MHEQTVDLSDGKVQRKSRLSQGISRLFEGRRGAQVSLRGLPAAQ